MCTSQAANTGTQQVEYFLEKWNHCNELINNVEASPSTVEVVTTILTELIELLSQEHPVHTQLGTSCLGGKAGPLLSITICERIFEKLLVWVEGPPSQNSESLLRLRDQQRVHLLTLFETLMTQSRQNVVTEIAILRPLLQFLFKLSSQLHPAYSRVYGRTLYELCVLLCRDSLFLDFCRKVCEELFGQPHIVFSMLVPLIHQSGAVGDWARDAFLLVLSVSKRDDALGNYLAFESDFCPILATGLSGLYSSLPKKLIPRHELPCSQDSNSPGGPVTLTSTMILEPLSTAPCVVELPVGGPSWHQLAESEWNQSTDLRRFLHTLDFCNLVIKICHQNVRDQLLYFINSGFLVPVLGSALHQSALDEVVAATAYLELLLRRLTEPALIKVVLNFIVNGTYDSCSILTSLINRLNSKAATITDVIHQLGMVTLSLFRTILSFHCEDVMYELVFKYLIPLYDSQLMPASGDSSSQSPKTLQQSRWRGIKTQEDSPTPSHPPSTHQIALDLVRAGDRFLALATTSAPDKRFDVGSSNQFMRYTKVVGSNGTSSEDSSARHSPTSQGNESISNGTISVMGRSTCSENGVTMNDWVLVRSRIAEISPPQTPSLFPYLRCTITRIRRRREACMAWRKSYPARNVKCSSVLNVCHTDKELEEDEHRDREDIHLSPSKPFSQPPDSPDKSRLSGSTGHPITSGDVRSNGDMDSPLPSSLATMSRAHTSSLYQLNFFDDSSEEEALSGRYRDESGLSTCREFSNPLDSFGLSPTSTVYLPMRQRVSATRCSCTCPTTTEALVVMEACCTSDAEQSTSESILDEEQMNRFINTLDGIGLPWECRMHFGHLPPSDPLNPPVDENFLIELDAKLMKCSIPLPDSPTRIEELEASSLHTRSDSLPRSSVSDKQDGPSLMHAVPLGSPRQSLSSSTVMKRSNISGPSTAAGIGPFLWILLSRLSSMHTNCLFTNLLLTDLLSALTAYPCPLLFDFLLTGTKGTQRTDKNSIYKCLRSVRNQLLSGAAVTENWHSLIYRARLYLSCEKQFLADMLLDPEFYCPRKPSRFSTRLHGSDHGTRSASVDRPSKFFNPQTNSRILLPMDVDSHRQHSCRMHNTPSPTGRSDSLLPCPFTPSKQSAFPNSLTPLLPVDYPRRRRDRPGRTALKTQSRASFSHAPPTVLRVGQHHLSTASISKPIWTRTARYAISPALSRANLFSSGGPRQAPQVDSSESEDEEMQTVYQSEIPANTRNLVFAAIVFDEFCHELAALCYNHSLDRTLFT